MGWDEELAELERRREMVRGMGGPESVAFQHSRGKLTVRERLDLLADPGSLREFGGLSGSGTYDDQGALVALSPRGEVNAICLIDGRKVVVTAGDFTIRGGSASGLHGGGLGQELRPNERAHEWQIPLIRLLDAAGGSVRGFEELGRTYMPDGNIWSAVDTQLLSEVPVVSAVMGTAAGLPAVNACLSHFSVMVEGTSQVFPGGPPVVKAALGYDISKEDLGGPQITTVSGSINNVAPSEEEALAQIRRFLSYLPASVHELPPVAECSDPTDRVEPELRNLVPREPRRIHDARRLLDLVLDRDSFFEIAPAYGRSRITGLARLGGRPVGVMTNNPRYAGGATDVAGGSKVIRLLQLCDTFHLPLVSLADEPGFLVGLDSEKAGIERAGARLVAVTCLSRMPWITIVVRRLYGVAGQVQHRPSGMFRRYAWPSANWGSMHIAGGTSAAYRREIDSADDPAARQAQIENRLRAVASPFRTAEATGQDIIDPAETRPLLCEFVEDAQRILARQLGPSPLPYLP